MKAAAVCDPAGVWEQYQRGITQKNEIGLFDRVRENEGFYLGDQWEGVNAPGLEKPVLNFIGRVVDYQTAMLSSETIATSVSLFNRPEDEETQMLTRILSGQIDQFAEDTDLSGLCKDLLRSAAVDGDCCLHLYLDADAPTGQAAEGLVKCEEIENTSVTFGNPQSANVEKQPYLILASRRLCEDVREEAAANGMSEDEAMHISPDSEETAGESKPGDDGMVTVLTKYWRADDGIHAVRTTKTHTIRQDCALGYRRYPVAWMNWTSVRGSAYGRAAVTGLIPNQIAVNKMYAMGIKQQRENAFRKILYNRNVFPNGWSNKIGAIGVTGDPREAVNAVSVSADIPESLIGFSNALMTNTRDLMGASDSALGNVKPDNTSAIIVTQEATAVPLEKKRRSFYSFLEDVIRSALDIMAADYGVREVMIEDDLGNQSTAEFDFRRIRDMILKLKIDVGQTAFWDEDQQVQTIDNLYRSGVITDKILYLEQIPDSKLKHKNRLIAKIRQQELAAQQAAQAAAAAQAGPAELAGGIADAVPGMQS